MYSKLTIKRILAGYSQRSVAKILGVTNTSVCKWEKGINSFDKWKHELAELYGCKVEDLYD